MENHKVLKLKITKDFLYKKYIDEKLSSYDIAKLTGYCYGHIQKLLNDFEIPLKHSYIDIIDKKFGMLTAQKFMGIDKNKQALWFCKCDCGKDKIVPRCNLVKALTSSCGCLRRIKYHELISGIKFGNIRKGAETRGLEFKITIEYIWNLFKEQNGKCILSGVDIILDPDNKNTTASLDRKDSSKGYLEGNVQWTHKDINYMKMSMSDEEFLKWIGIIYLHNQNKEPA